MLLGWRREVQLFGYRRAYKGTNHLLRLCQHRVIPAENHFMTANKAQRKEKFTDVIYIWWDEFDRRELPARCMRCGKKNAKWNPYRFNTWTYKNMRRYKVARKCEIPLCDEHGGGYVTLKAIQAREFDKQGVWALNVDEDFVDALEKHRKNEIATWKEDNGDREPDEFDEGELPPGLRMLPKKPEPLRMSWVWPAIIVVGLVALLLVFGLGICLCFGAMPLLMRAK